MWLLALRSRVARERVDIIVARAMCFWGGRTGSLEVGGLDIAGDIEIWVFWLGWL
jgi:hypothetical protein